MSNTKYNKLIQKSIKTYNKLRNNRKVKNYKLVTKIVESIAEKQPERKYWKSTKTNDYYIELPYEKLVPTKKGVKYEHRGYNCIYCKKGANPKDVIGWGNFCLSLCNLTEEQLKDNVNKFLEFKKKWN